MSAVSSISELARLLEVTRPSLRGWMARDGFPGGRQGPWDADAVQRYLRANSLGQYRLNGPILDDGGDVEEGGNDLHALRCRKMAQEVLKLEIDNLERQGLLSDPTQQIQAFSVACQSINRGLDELVMRCAVKLVGCKDQHDVSEILRDEIDRLKLQLRSFQFEEDAV